MNRWARTALLAAGLAASGLGTAQEGRIAFVRSGLVSFTVTPEAFAAAGACPACEPLAADPGPEIVLEVGRQNPNRLYTIDVLHAGWGGLTDLALEARYTVASTDGRVVFLTTPWLPIGIAPVLVFTQAPVQRETRVRVDVVYRLALRGDEPAGTYLARVTHRVRENGTAVSHDVRVSLPAFLSLRIVGSGGPDARTTVVFDYANAPAAYLQAITDATPLEPTRVDLDRVEVSSNHPTGYTVTARVEEVLAPSGGVAIRDRLWLAGTAAHGREFSATRPTAGFATLVQGDEFALRVDGSESPGTYVLVVTFEAALNP